MARQRLFLSKKVIPGGFSALAAIKQPLQKQGIITGKPGSVYIKRRKVQRVLMPVFQFPCQ